MTFVDKLDEYCNYYSAKQLSEITGVPQSTISSYRDGVEPNKERKAILSEIIGYDESQDKVFHQEIEFVDLEEAAARMGWGITKLQCALRAKEFNFGSGFKGTGKSYIYYILRKPFEKFIQENS